MSFVDCWYKKSNMYLVEYVKGKKVVKTIPFKPYFYVQTLKKNATHKSIYGDNLIKIECDSQYGRRLELGAYRDGFTYEGSVPPIHQFMNDYYLDKNIEDDKPNFHIAYLDIEVEKNQFGKWPEVEVADGRVNLLTVYSSHKKKFYVFGLEHDYKPKEKDVIYTKCETEGDLFNGFLGCLKKLKYDIITGWNSEAYDIPYLVNRIRTVLNTYSDDDKLTKIKRYRKVGGKYEFSEVKEKKPDIDHALRMSPIGVLRERVVVDDYSKEEFLAYEIRGAVHLDYLKIYKKFILDPRASYNLNYIGSVELGEKKVQYEGDLETLYTTDWNKFCEYNIQDVRILIGLEEKKQ